MGKDIDVVFRVSGGMFVAHLSFLNLYTHHNPLDSILIHLPSIIDEDDDALDVDSD